jgi:molecular chaperone GrpE
MRFMSKTSAGKSTPPPGDAVEEVRAEEGATSAEEIPVDIGPAEPEEAPPAAMAEDAAALKDRWLRAEAELQNYRRRAARERQEARLAAEESVMLEIITALDDLERALAAAGESGAPEPWVAGVRLVANRLADYLARQGVVVLDPAGQPFDPVFHEAILEVADAGVEPGRVTEVVLKGWRRGDRALRAARVVVARSPAEKG